MQPVSPEAENSGSRLEVRRLLFELVYEVENVAGCPAEPIELHHHQFVARPDEFEDRGELVAAITALAAYLLGADDLTSGRPAARLLGDIVLVAGGQSFWNIWIGPQEIV
jgi:hypothetical protein